jgi:hypothetical protein
MASILGGTAGRLLFKGSTSTSTRFKFKLLGGLTVAGATTTTLAYRSNNKSSNNGNGNGKSNSNIDSILEGLLFPFNFNLSSSSRVSCEAPATQNNVKLPPSNLERRVSYPNVELRCVALRFVRSRPQLMALFAFISLVCFCKSLSLTLALTRIIALSLYTIIIR